MLSLIFTSLYVFILMLKAVCVRAYKRQFKVTPFTGTLASVTIFQPILSGDLKLKDTLEQNIATFPDVQFNWLIDKDDDVAMLVANDLHDQHPSARITIQRYDQAPQGINPKLFKLQSALELCTEEFIVVLDDDTVLPLESLKVLLGELSHATIATGLPSYSEGDNFASRILSAFVNNNAAMTYLATLPFMQPITVNGMCYAIKRESLLKLSGFQAISHHLTDDLAIAELVLDNGGTISQTPFVQRIETHLSDLSAYGSQMHRWYVFANLLFAKQTLSIRVLMTLLYAVPSLLLWLLIITVVIQFSISLVLLLLAALLMRHATISYHNETKNAYTPSNVLTSLLSEIIQPVHILHALFVRTIRWRSRRYRVYSSDRFESVER